MVEKLNIPAREQIRYFAGVQGERQEELEPLL